jgi:hypothetical protein
MTSLEKYLDRQVCVHPGLLRPAARVNAEVGSATAPAQHQSQLPVAPPQSRRRRSSRSPKSLPGKSHCRGKDGVAPHAADQQPFGQTASASQLPVRMHASQSGSNSGCESCQPSAEGTPQNCSGRPSSRQLSANQQPASTWVAPSMKAIWSFPDNSTYSRGVAPRPDKRPCLPRCAINAVA